MKVLVVGAGFAGLSVCYYLQVIHGAQVTLCDKKGIASGASGASCGLMHPYVGEDVKRSFMAKEAFEESKSLIEAASFFSSESFSDFSGVSRRTESVEQSNKMLLHAATFKDIIPLSDHLFLITLGATLQTIEYLNALWQACEKAGSTFLIEDITDLSTYMIQYDAIIIAAGEGVFHFQETKSFPLGQVRGQSLKCLWPPDVSPLERSLVGKGYAAVYSDKNKVCFGATFERGVETKDPDFATAMALLAPKMNALLPSIPLVPIEARAGIRVSTRGHYLPLVGKVKEKLFLFSGLGSRGLLYHAFFGKMLANLVVHGDDSAIPYISKKLFTKNVTTYTM
ncbi:MAG: FAD-binding oxidoreductase [Chlamydiae bacterium]|nr:FAD-binding oxidoreductase [Chlamydiota bacterium]